MTVKAIGGLGFGEAVTRESAREGLLAGWRQLTTNGLRRLLAKVKGGTGMLTNGMIAVDMNGRVGVPLVVG